MKAVYKYPLKIDDYQQVILPVGAETLCVKVQNGNVCLWALIDKEYTDHDWGVYKYNGITKDVAEEMISLL